MFIAQRLRILPSNYTLPLLIPEIESNLRCSIYNPYVRHHGPLEGWVATVAFVPITRILTIGQDVYRKTEHEDEDEAHAADAPYMELDTPEHAGNIRGEFIAKKLVAQGGSACGCSRLAVRG